MLSASPWQTLTRSAAVLVTLLFSTLAHAQPSISISVNPNPLAANQVAELIITVTNGRPSTLGQPPLPPPMQLTGSFQQQTQATFDGNNRPSITTQNVWGILCEQPGTYTIPPIEMQVDGQSYKTQPLTVEVKPAAQMQKPTGRTPGQDNGLGAGEPILQITMPKTEFYQGEIVPIIATLYVVRGTGVDVLRNGLIEVEKNDVAIQRFPQQAEQSFENLGNKSYVAFTFRSSLSALKAGKMTVGPTKMDVLLGIPVGRDRIFGMIQQQQRKVTVNASEIAINVLPLPTEGKPKGFGGAVGEFTMTATANTQTTTVGDPVAVDVQIAGSGNFDAITPPTLTDSVGWKSYPPKRYNVDNTDPNTADLMNRRLGFNTILVPEKVTTAVPPFEFSFFNPNTKSYSTLRSQPIVLTVNPAPNAPAAGAAAAPGVASANGPKLAAPALAPEADITDILMPIPASPRWATASAPLFSDKRFMVFNAVLALAMVALVVLTFLQRAKQRLANSPARALSDLLRQVQAADLSEAQFYQLAARYVHQSTGGKPPAEASAILSKYEALNFAGPSAGSGSIATSERSDVLSILKQLKSIVATALLLMLSIGSTQASENDAYQAAAQALQKNDFKAAQKEAEAAVKDGHLGADIFTLLGHAAYKLGQPGLAAVWYQRAALFPSAAPEVRQNLRHIHDKVPFFTWYQNDLLQRFGQFFSRNTWGWLATLGTWACIIAFVFAWKTGRWWSALSVVPIGALCAVIGLIGWLVRPSHESIESLAFVINTKAQAHTAATQVSGTVINVPPGSTVKKLEQRGNWTYVEIRQEPDNLRGWLPTNQLESVWPYDAAMLP